MVVYRLKEKLREQRVRGVYLMFKREHGHEFTSPCTLGCFYRGTRLCVTLHKLLEGQTPQELLQIVNHTDYKHRLIFKNPLIKGFIEGKVERKCIKHLFFESQHDRYSKYIQQHQQQQQQQQRERKKTKATESHQDTTSTYPIRISDPKVTPSHLKLPIFCYY